MPLPTLFLPHCDTELALEVATFHLKGNGFDVSFRVVFSPEVWLTSILFELELNTAKNSPDGAVLLLALRVFEVYSGASPPLENSTPA